VSHLILPDLLYSAAKEFPHDGIGFIQPDKSICVVTYPELLEQSLRILQGMQEIGIEAGDRIILSLGNSKETIPAIWASFLGGVIPALLQPPLSFSEYNPAADKAEKVFRILDNPRVIISHEHLNNWVESKIPETNIVDILNLVKEFGTPDIPKIGPNDLALIQFSSGSTGDPKGVKLTHRNIISNMVDIIEGIRLTHKDVSISWMPLYHDMGLIGFHITPTLVGCQQYLLDPVDFVKNPSLWLDNLSSKRCNITGCPNFGQALVNRHIARKKNPEWDFSHVRIIFNGAEPISTITMREFVANLSMFGLQPVSMFPAYGLAEATLAVTFTSLEKEAEILRFQRIPLIGDGIAMLAKPENDCAIELVNLGKQLTNCTVRIIGDDGNEVAEATAGSVLVRGDNVSSGYFKHKEATRQTFVNGWLHTGDLGFIYNGNLFIMGRQKDVIFLNGNNFYCHDLEHVVSSLQGILSGKLIISAYFDPKEGSDKLLVFLVGSDNKSTRILFARIKIHLMQTLGLFTNTFIPIKSNDIPRTSSGKIQRYKMVNRFLQGEFNVVRL